MALAEIWQCLFVLPAWWVCLRTINRSVTHSATIGLDVVLAHGVEPGWIGSNFPIFSRC